MTKSRDQRIDDAVKEIEWFHDLGKELLEKLRKAPDEDKGKMTAAEVERLELNPQTLYKARQFADPKAGYTRQEVRDLCRMLTRQKGNGDEKSPVFGRSYVVRLLPLPKHSRAELQAAAIEQAWGYRRLGLEIAKRSPRRKPGGRRRKIPGDLLGLLAQVEGMCETWRRWRHDLGSDTDGTAEGRVRLADLPDDLKELVEAVSGAVGKLHADVAERLEQERKAEALESGREEAEVDGKPGEEKPPGRRQRRP